MDGSKTRYAEMAFHWYMTRPWPDTLMWIFEELLRHFGKRKWWPGETEFEIIVGAILTQNTAWTNVEKAIRNLEQAGLLEPGKMHRTPETELALLVRPSGYYNQKAKRLKIFVDHLFRAHEGDLFSLLSSEIDELRKELLALEGIGPETADSIILYAAGKPTFVVDAYTFRLVKRFPFPVKVGYYPVKDFFESNLDRDLYIFNEYHALLVELGKNICTSRKPSCGNCPLKKRCRKKVVRQNP